MDLSIPAELDMLRRLARRFVDDELMPLERDFKLDMLEELPDLIRGPLIGKMQATGLWALAAPREYGGGGIGLLGFCLVVEESYKCLVGRNLWLLGNPSGFDYQRPDHLERYILPTIRGEKRGCAALSEPNAAGDLAGIETTATRDGDTYVINGAKCFVSLAGKADYAVVLTRLKGTTRRDGMTWFVVDRGTPGFRVVRQQEMLGGYDTYELAFEDCVVPAANLLGEPGQAWNTGQERLGQGRIQIGARALGVAERCLSLATSYAKRRWTFGHPLADRQGVQFMLADSAVEIHASRLMVVDAAWKAERGEDVRQEAAMVKLFASEMAGRVADRALQIHGAAGLTKDLPLERLYRDARPMRIYEGPSEVQCWVIARNLLRK
jgi:acyl-CoA dehydrogenase